MTGQGNERSSILRKADFGPAGFRWLTLTRIQVGLPGIAALVSYSEVARFRNCCQTDTVPADARGANAHWQHSQLTSLHNGSVVTAVPRSKRQVSQLPGEIDDL